MERSSYKFVCQILRRDPPDTLQSHGLLNLLPTGNHSTASNRRKYYSYSQVADMLGVDRQTVYRWVRKGDLRAHKCGRQVRIPQDALDDFMVQSAI